MSNLTSPEERLEILTYIHEGGWRDKNLCEVFTVEETAIFLTNLESQINALEHQINVQNEKFSLYV